MESITTVCVSGHRQIPFDDALSLPPLLERTFLELYARGAREFRAGGALGYDMVAELKLLELQERLPDLRLCLYLPCRDQADRWSEHERRAYRYILDRADAIHYSEEAYVSGCMLKRNREMVQGCEVLVAYCTQSSGGTAYTVRYAKKLGVQVINLAAQCEQQLRI